MPENSSDASTGMPGGASSRWVRRLPRMILVFGLILYSAVMLRVVDSSFPSGVDAARYLMLSQNILSGEGYVDSYRPWPTPHIKFPPVLPCLLALAQRLVPDSMIAMKIAVAAFGLLALLATFFLLRCLQTGLAASILTMALGIQISILTNSQRLMSDIPYLFFSTLALLLVIKRFQKKEASVWYDAVIGFTMSLAVLTRTIGVALLPALIVAAYLNRDVHKRRRCIMVVSLIVIATVVGWEVRNTIAIRKFMPVYGTLFIHKDYNDARQGLVGPEDLLKRWRRSTQFYHDHLVSVVIPNVSRIRLILPFFLLFAGCGWLVRLLTRRSPLEFYVLFYALILFVWPWTFDRFLLPIAGLLLFYFAHGFGLAVQGIWIGSWSALTRLGPTKTRSVACPWPSVPLNVASVCLASFICLISLYVPVVLLSSDRARDKFNRPAAGFPEFVTAVWWIGKHTPGNVVILTERAAAAYVISGRKSFSPRDIQASGMFRDAVARNGLFVIQSAKPGCVTASKPIARTLERTRGHWHVVFRAGATYVIAQNGAEVREGRF